jgi:hypothetical protein
MGRNPIGSRKMSGKERVALHRARKAEKAASVQERDALIKDFGIDRVENLEYTNRMCQMALHIQAFFQNKPSKITQATVEEAIGIVSRWLDIHWESGWDILPDYPDEYRQAVLMGLLPAAGHVGEYFANLYRQFQAVPNTGESK